MGKQTPLYEEHLKLGATMSPFAGWDMPIYYSAVMDEHAAVRERAGLFDTCHMGEIEVSGLQSADFLQSLLTNDLWKMRRGEVLYSALTNERGGCVDDLTVYMFNAQTFCLVVNASTVEKDLAWVRSHAEGWDVTVADRSESTGMLALQGPAAMEIIAKLTDEKLPERFKFLGMNLAGIEALVSRTGYTGEDGVEMYLEWEQTAAMWSAIFEAGKPLGLQPVGLGARDTLRLEACYSLYGHELTEDITPAEAGITFAVTLDKTFPGSEVVLRQIEEGPARKIMAFELTERGVPRDGYPVFAGGEKAGYVTSGCYSPTYKKGIGLAMLDAPFAKVGAEIAVEIRGKRYAGNVVKRPFLKLLGI